MTLAALLQVRFVDDVDLAYVALRNRQVHDLWHVVFGCPTTVSGELGLKALEFVQARPASVMQTALRPPTLNGSMPMLLCISW